MSFGPVLVYSTPDTPVPDVASRWL